MKRLDNVIEFYLKTTTNSVLVINGGWGTGKTYYYKNHLEPKIQAIEINGTKYRSIVISLFGLKSVEDIQADILLELLSSKNKKLKLAWNIAKLLAKGALKLAHAKEYSRVISDILTKVPKEGLIQLENLVLCFDDFERISRELNIEELIGFINNLTEGAGVKIILIANEKELDEENKKKFGHLKEKVVGNSIEFNPDIKEAARNLITSNSDLQETYKGFLLENLDFIVAEFTKGSQNLRTLNFIITYFQSIFSQINSLITKESEEILFSKKTEILPKALKYLIAISIEYKEGTINLKGGRLRYGNDQGLNWSPAMVDFEKFWEGTTLDPKTTETENPFRSLFVEKYYSKDQFYFFPSIYNFLTGGDIFSGETFINELKKVFNITDGQIPHHVSIFQKLINPGWHELTDVQNLTLVREVLGYADKGMYSLTDYPSIFYCATRFDNPLRFNLYTLEKRIIKGMERGEKNYQYVDALDLFFSMPPDTENKEHIKRIFAAVRRLNEKLKLNRDRNQALRMEELLQLNFEEFSKQTLSTNGSLISTPFLVHFNLLKLYQYLCTNNENRINFARFLQIRYTPNFSRLLSPEISFLKKLHEKISKRKEIKRPRNVTGYAYAQLNKQLQLAIEVLEAQA